MSNTKMGLQGIPNNMGDMQGQRLYTILDAISERLLAIENKLSEVVRLEERVENHSRLLSKNSEMLDEHDRRLKVMELWLAKHEEGSATEKVLSNMQEETSWIRKKMTEIETSKILAKSERDMGKEILKWTAGILGAIVVFMVTGQIK